MKSGKPERNVCGAAPSCGVVGRPALFLVLLLALLLPALPAAAAAAETVLMLGVVRDGKYDARATHAVSERLARAGETLAPAPHLTAAERQCLQGDCLDSLAEREKAPLVLMARVQQSAGFAYIAASLYDAEHKRPLDVSAICDKCLPEALALRIGDLYQRLLRDRRDRLRAEASGPRPPGKAAAEPARPTGAAASETPRPAAGSAAAPAKQAASAGGTLVASKAAQWPSTGSPGAAPEPAAADTETPPGIAAAVRATQPARAPARLQDRIPPISPRRKLIAGVLGGLGTATLITAIALTVTDGQMTTMDCPMGAAAAKVCVLDNKVAYTLGYAATSAFAVSIGMTLLWPERTKSSSITQSR